MTPVLTPLLERAMTAPPTPAQPDLLSVVEKIKALLPAPETNLRREIREAFREGQEIGRERALTESGEGGRSWVQDFFQGLGHALPELVHAARQSGFLGPGAGGTTQALPAAEAQGGQGGGPTINPVFAEIMDALIEELKKPQEQRDLPGIAAFLESIVLDGSGETMLDRLAPIARSPERLAQLSLKLIDARLMAPEVWPGTKALLDYVKGEATKAETEGR